MQLILLFLFGLLTQKKESKKDITFGILRLEYRIHKGLYLVNLCFDGYLCISGSIISLDQWWLRYLLVLLKYYVKQLNSKKIKGFLFLENKFLSIA